MESTESRNVTINGMQVEFLPPWDSDEWRARVWRFYFLRPLKQIIPDAEVLDGPRPGAGAAGS